MKTNDYFVLASISYCPAFCVDILFYILFLIPEGRRAHLLDTPLPILLMLMGAAFIFCLLLALIVALLTKSSLSLCNKFNITGTKQIAISALLLIYWFLPFTIPGLLCVMAEEGVMSQAVALNVLGRIILGGLFFLLPTVVYLLVLRKQSMNRLFD